MEAICICQVTFLFFTSISAYLRSFQYKILSNVLYLNKKLHTLVYQTNNCCFCKMEEETISHQFYYCNQIQNIWNQVQTYFTDCLRFSQLTSQTTIFGFNKIDNDTFQSHILLSLRLHIYNVQII